MSSWRFLPQGYAERVAGTGRSESARMLANALMSLGGNLATGFNRGTQAVRSDMDRAQELQSRVLSGARTPGEIEAWKRFAADRFGYLGAPYAGQPAPVPRRQPLPTPRAVPQPPPAQVPKGMPTQGESLAARARRREANPPPTASLVAPSTTPDHSGTFGDPAPAPDPEQPVKKIQGKWARGLPNTDITYKQFLDIYEAPSAEESTDPRRWTKFHKGKNKNRWTSRYKKYKGLHEKHLAKPQTAPGQPVAKPIAKPAPKPAAPKEVVAERKKDLAQRVSSTMSRSYGALLPETVEEVVKTGGFRGYEIPLVSDPATGEMVPSDPLYASLIARTIEENKEKNRKRKESAVSRVVSMSGIKRGRESEALRHAMDYGFINPDHLAAKPRPYTPYSRAVQRSTTPQAAAARKRVVEFARAPGGLNPDDSAHREAFTHWFLATNSPTEYNKLLQKRKGITKVANSKEMRREMERSFPAMQAAARAPQDRQAAMAELRVTESRLSKARKELNDFMTKEKPMLERRGVDWRRGQKAYTDAIAGLEARAEVIRQGLEE